MQMSSALRAVTDYTAVASPQAPKASKAMLLARQGTQGRRLAVAEATRVSPGEDIPAVWLVGAHGGAGVSTLAHAIAPAGDAGMVWPQGESSQACVVVCRSTAMGLDAAHDALIQASYDPDVAVDVLGLVVVADAPGRTPKALEQKITVISSVAARVWRVPYLEAWRLAQSVEALPVWRPGDEVPRKRRGRIPPDVVPPAVGEVAAEMFEAFRVTRRKQQQN